MNFFINLPLRYIAAQPAYLDLFIEAGLNPELGLDAQALDTLSTSWHRKTCSKLKNAGLKCSIHLPFYDLHPGSPDRLIRKASRERLDKAIEVCGIYSPEHLITHTGLNGREDTFLGGRAAVQICQTWEELFDKWPDCPQVFMENVYEKSPHILAEILGHSGNHRLGCCLDLGHWHFFAGGKEKNNFNTWLNALSDFKIHLHLHDNNGAADEHLGLGAGAINWQSILLLIEKMPAMPNATFEPHSPLDLIKTIDFMEKASEMSINYFGEQNLGKAKKQIESKASCLQFNAS